MPLATPQETFLSHKSPLSIRLLNYTGALFQSLGLTTSLELENIERKVIRHTDLSDFGDRSYREGLIVLLDDINSRANLPLVGRLMFKQMVSTALTNRLLIQNRLANLPTIRSNTIVAPLFVVGYPRTGTTLLHTLLSIDPNNRTVKMYEALKPALGRKESDSRIVEANKFIKILNQISPTLSRIHALEPRGPDECLKLIENTFISPHFLLYVDTPKYWQWLKEKKPAELQIVYEYHKLQLQMLGLEKPVQRWVLKAPAHLFFLSTLLDVYPDARIVYLHRKPAEAVPSFCSLIAVSRAVAGATIDPIAIGKFALEFYKELSERGQRARKYLSEGRIIDIFYDDLIADPLKTVDRIYSHFDYETPANFRKSLAAWINENPKNKFGTHVYSCESFGLSQMNFHALNELEAAEAG